MDQIESSAARSPFNESIGAASGDHLQAYSGPLTLDAPKYRHFVDGFDGSEDRKRQLLEAVWEIVVSFVDLGYGLHPVSFISKEIMDVACDSARVIPLSDNHCSNELSGKVIEHDTAERTRP